MAFVINLIAGLLLFLYPYKFYGSGDIVSIRHPFYPQKLLFVNPELCFLLYSILTAMVFLGPFSLFKYAYWIIFLIVLSLNRLDIKFGAIVWAYLAFLAWAVISAVFFSTVKFQALMMVIKYFLPVLYLWLGYTAIKDSDDLAIFMYVTAIGMCVYALIIGGFSAKLLGPLYSFLNFSSGGLFISYASLADYFSGLIVIPIALYIVTRNNKWLYATIWIILSTILETVRTGLGGIFLASSFFLFTIYRAKSMPWIAGLCLTAVIIVFSVPSFREKMFKNDDVSITEFKVDDANFNNINSHAREFIWEMNLERFYEPHKLTGSGLGESVDWMKNTPGLKLIHSDYVEILCDMGLIGLWLFVGFAIITLYDIISTSWSSGSPFVLKLTGGMALGSCAGTFFSMAFDNVVAYAQQSYVLPFILIGIYLKVKDLYLSNSWK